MSLDDLDDNDPRPAYLQLAAILRADFQSGVLKPGDRLPSARKLADRFSIAQMTVRQAIKVLSDEGIVISRQGKGTFVRSAPSSDSSVDVVTSLVKRVEALEREIRDLKCGGNSASTEA